MAVIDDLTAAERDLREVEARIKKAEQRCELARQRLRAAEVKMQGRKKEVDAAIANRKRRLEELLNEENTLDQQLEDFAEVWVSGQNTLEDSSCASTGPLINDRLTSMSRSPSPVQMPSGLQENRGSCIVILKTNIKSCPGSPP